ncbi:MAG: hypothetical protein WC680_07255 [Sulfuricurvum sp.]|jgi:hypothetical protein
MKNQQNTVIESRRGFLKKSAYMAPAIMMLGSLNAYANSNGDSKGPGSSTLKACKENNGFGNGDQNAPGNSLHHNGAENDTSAGSNAKNKVNNVGVDTHGGHEKDFAENNGFGNGDQNAPGNSLHHNGAENDLT